MLLLAIGTGTAKIIGVVAIPVLTRIYTPEEFGALSVFSALIIFLSPLMSLRFETALPLPKSDKLAINLFALCFLLVFVNILLLSVVLILGGRWLFQAFSIDTLQPYWWLLMLGILGSSTYEILSYWATRKKAFKCLAKAQVWQAVVGSTIKISLGLLGLNSTGLLVGQVAQQAAGGGGVIRYFYSTLLNAFKHMSNRLICYSFFRYFDYLTFKLPAHLLFVFSSQAPVLFTSMFYGEELTGQLGLTMMAFSIPLGLIGQTTAKAFYSEVSALGKENNQQIYQITIDVITKTALVGGAIFIFLFLFSPYIFSTVFGEEWRVSGELAQILSIYLLFQFVASPIINVLNVFDRQKMAFNIHLIRAVFVAIIFVGGVKASVSYTSILTIYSIVMSFHYAITTFSILRVVRRGN